MGKIKFFTTQEVIGVKDVIYEPSLNIHIFFLIILGHDAFIFLLIASSQPCWYVLSMAPSKKNSRRFKQFRLYFIKMLLYVLELMSPDKISGYPELEDLVGE